MASNQCLCLKADLNQCTRLIAGDQKYCWQHHNCQLDIKDALAKKSEAPKKQEGEIKKNRE